MRAFLAHQGTAAPLTEAGALRRNVDTDAIIPSREMRLVSKTSLAEGLFANWRYLSAYSRDPNPDFVLNQSAFSGASVLIAGENFGCGSSREQAVWALAEFGIRALIAPSFGAIFARNCVANGLLTVVLAGETVQRIADWVLRNPRDNQPLVDLAQEQVTAFGERLDFQTPPAERLRLMKGLDHIELSLSEHHLIDEFERNYFETADWVSLR